MIDPLKITNFNRAERELQEFLIFCICAAGKNSDVQSKKVEEFLKLIENDICFRTDNYFNWIDHNGVITSYYLHKVKMGQYFRICKTLFALAKESRGVHNAWVEKCNREDLLSVTCIGYKTASMFLLHSRPRQKLIVLDTHLSKWLQCKGIKDAKVGLSPIKYKDVEKRAIPVIRKHFPKIGLAKADLKIWKEVSKR